MPEAEYLFYSPFTPDHHAAGPNTIKVFITGENLCPDFNACDYAISGEYMSFGDRHLRVPVYATYESSRRLAHRERLGHDDLSRKSMFCNFIYSNSLLAHPIREQFFHALNAELPVTSAGKFLSNDQSLGARDASQDWGAEKREFVKKFRFTIAIENSEHPGYVTEKLTDALLARTAPIYWGDPRIAEEFNKDAFLHLRDYSDHARAIEDIRRLNASSDHLLDMINAPVFVGNIDRVANYLSAARSFIEFIFDQPHAIARRRPRHGWTQWLEQKRRKDQTGLRKRLKANRF